MHQISTGFDSFSTSSQGIANVDILNAVKCSLSQKSIITMNDVCEEYMCLLHENCVHPVGNLTTYKKNLKRIISENIDDVKFVKSHCANESEQVLSEKLLSATVSDTREQTGEDDVNILANAAAILKKELTSNEQWKFTGSKSMLQFQAPPKLASFVRWLLVGTENKEVKGKRDEATVK